MFGGNEPQGFTLVETMIFLGVTGVLFLGVLGLINGKQNQTYYFQGTHEFYSQVESLANDVQNGYYDTSSNFTCTAVAGLSTPPTVTYNSSKAQGTNNGCTFIGRLIQFGTKTSNTQYVVYTVLGRQFAPNTTSLTPTTDLTDAYPMIIGGDDSADPAYDAITVNLPPGLEFAKVSYTEPSVPKYAGVNYDSLIGFFSSFPSVSPNGDLLSSASSPDLIPVPSNTTPAVSSSEFVDSSEVACDVSQMQNSGGTDSIIGVSPTGCAHSLLPTYENPSGGVIVCLKSTGLSNTFALVTIGGGITSNNATGNPLNVQLSGASSCP